MNYGQVKAQFTGLMNRRDLTANTTLVGTFIDQAIARVQRELRCPAMEKSVLVTIGSGYSGLIIPNDLLELISIIPQESNDRLFKCDIARALKLAQQPGCPQEYCRQGGLWVLGPAPEAGTIVRIDYYAEFAPLVADTDTNIATLILWDLIVYAALSVAADYYRDSNRDAFEQRYQQIRSGLQAQADADELDGCTVMTPAYRYWDCE